MFEKKESLILVDLSMVSRGRIRVQRTIEMTRKEREAHIKDMKIFNDKLEVFTLHDLIFGKTIWIDLKELIESIKE